MSGRRLEDLDHLFRFKGLVCYLSDLTYILVDLNFLYTPSITA